MNRILCLTVGLVLLFLLSASAEVYRCRTSDGKLVMTDKQTELPADCKPVEGSAGTGSFNIVPDNTRKDVESQPALPEQKAASDVQDVSTWQSHADALVQDYKAAARQHHRATLEVDRRHAVQEIEELKQQKQEMLNSLASSGLTRDEHQAIRKTLDEIPQR